MDDYELIDNEENHQYEFHIGKYIPRTARYISRILKCL